MISFIHKNINIRYSLLLFKELPPFHFIFVLEWGTFCIILGIYLTEHWTVVTGIYYLPLR
jgi:hypothetical protein